MTESVLWLRCSCKTGVTPFFKMRYSCGSSIETSPVGDRVVLYDRRSRKAVVLNPTGASLWRDLSTPRTAGELSQRLQARFPAANAAQVAMDVEAYLRDLNQQQLLHIEET